ncbi:MAG: CidA/LrgA family protein [Candidatus Faecousia sp.]|nr:CidA/LrgA family protein [Candidatus Faecousia sp.]
MKYVYQATIIFGFTLLGELLHLLIPLPIPAAIYGLVLLFLALQVGIVKLHQVDAVSKFLIAVMGLLFVAPAVNIVEIWADIAPSLGPILVILVVSTVLVFAAAGLTTRWMLKRGGEKNG